MVFSVQPNGPLSDRWSEMMKYMASRPVPFVSAAEPAKDALSQGRSPDAAQTARGANLVDGFQRADQPSKAERGAPAPTPTGDISVAAAGPPASTVTKGLGQVRREAISALLDLPKAIEPVAQPSYAAASVAQPSGRAVDIKA